MTSAATSALKESHGLGSIELKGSRLTLRRPRLADAVEIHDGIGHYDVVNNLSRAPWPYEFMHAVEWLTKLENADEPLKDFPFAIVRDGHVIGVVGVHLNPEGPELGYWLRQSAWGQGYATEAARLALAFAFADLDLSEVEAGHFADNPASGRVLQKLGFAYTGDQPRYSLARGSDVVCRMMILPRARFAEGRTQEGASHGG